MRATTTGFRRFLIPGAAIVGAVLLIAAAMTSGAGVAEARGNSPPKLTAAGWECLVLGEVHCLAPNKDLGGDAASIPVLIFDTDDVEDAEAAFLGTEILIHHHLYHGQPCPQEGLDGYVDLSGFGLPYFACHRYDTSP